MEQKKVHLVLGCGGARGVAHIGVIEMLEESGYEIISVTGCSMGAVVGGIYAAGFQQPYKEWMLKLTRSMVLKIMDFTLSRQGFVKGERLFSILKEFTGTQQIENFKIPFIAVAADMVKNEEVHYNSGDLYKALRASIAIPGVFTPVLENGQFLVDGGVLNPLPLNLVHKKDYEQIIAVNLNGAVVPIPLHEENISQKEQTLWRKLMWMQASKNKQNDLSPVAKFSIIELLQSTYRITQDRLTTLMLQAYPPDLLIEIPRNTCSTFDFHKAESLIELGRESCSKALTAVTTD